MKITLAILLMYAVIELLAPTNAHAFGKPKEAVAAKSATVRPAPTKPVVTQPAIVVPVSAKPVQVKPAVIEPVYVKPALPVVAHPTIVNKEVFKKVAKKPAKPKVAVVLKDPITQTTKPTEPPAVVQPTTGQVVGQKVDQGIDTVGGLFNRFKASVNNPVTQNSCSTAQKAMSQC